MRRCACRRRRRRDRRPSAIESGSGSWVRGLRPAWRSKTRGSRLSGIGGSLRVMRRASSEAGGSCGQCAPACADRRSAAPARRRRWPGSRRRRASWISFRDRPRSEMVGSRFPFGTLKLRPPLVGQTEVGGGGCKFSTGTYTAEVGGGSGEKTFPSGTSFLGPRCPCPATSLPFVTRSDLAPACPTSPLACTASYSSASRQGARSHPEGTNVPERNIRPPGPRPPTSACSRCAAALAR